MAGRREHRLVSPVRRQHIGRAVKSERRTSDTEIIIKGSKGGVTVGADVHAVERLVIQRDTERQGHIRTAIVAIKAKVIHAGDKCVSASAERVIGAARLRRQFHGVCIGAAVKSSNHNQAVADGRSTGKGVCHIGVRPGAPRVPRCVIDISAVVGDSRRLHGRTRQLWSLATNGLARGRRVASADQISVCANGARGRPINGHRHRRPSPPAVVDNVVLIIVRRSRTAVPVALEIHEIAYNAVAGAAHGHGNRRKRRVPRVVDRIVRPGVGLFVEGGIKPAKDIDPAIAGMIDRRSKKRPAGSGMGAPLGSQLSLATS